MTDPPLLVARAAGDLHVDEVVDYQREVAAEEGTHGLDEIFDLTEVTDLQASREGVASVAKAASVTRPVRHPGKLAILATTDLAFGLARMYEAVSDGRGPRRVTRVCRTFEDAVSFLGLPEGFTFPEE